MAIELGRRFPSPRADRLCKPLGCYISHHFFSPLLSSTRVARRQELETRASTRQRMLGRSAAVAGAAALLLSSLADLAAASIEVDEEEDEASKGQQSMAKRILDRLAHDVTGALGAHP